MAIKRAIIIKVDKGELKRVTAKVNRLIKTVPIELDNGIMKILRHSRRIAKNEIQTQTQGRGTGLLASELRILTMPLGKNRKNYSLESVGRSEQYSKFVHDGFRPHFVRISDKPRLRNWIIRNMPADAAERVLFTDVIFVGGPNSASWIKRGGVKYMDTAFAEAVKLSRKEFDSRIDKLIKK